jgi:hypothetical protein
VSIGQVVSSEFELDRVCQNLPAVRRRSRTLGSIQFTEPQELQTAFSHTLSGFHVLACVVCSTLLNGFRCRTRQQPSCSDQVAGRCFPPKYGLAFTCIVLLDYWKIIRLSNPIHFGSVSHGTRLRCHRQQYTATRPMPLGCALKVRPDSNGLYAFAVIEYHLTWWRRYGQVFSQRKSIKLLGVDTIMLQDCRSHALHLSFTSLQFC